MFRFVSCFGVPPLAGISYNGDKKEGVNRMIPPELQAPPLSIGASQSICSPLPSDSIRLSFPPAKNPIERPSGDQKGSAAPSVPARILPSPASFRRRSHSENVPLVF